jgi:nitrogen fixation protein NifQ
MIDTDPGNIYAWLMQGAAATPHDAFDLHVLASALALGASEAAAAGCGLTETVGLDHREFGLLLDASFPHARGLLHDAWEGAALQQGDDELCLRRLLVRFGSHGHDLERTLAAIIARRAMRPNHLWQDLGLRNRGELSQLMQTHFRPLAQRNAADMKWKKLLYRMICRDEQYRLCTAPSCSECNDFAACFGDESGESLLALNRRKIDLSGVAESRLMVLR